MCRRLIKSAALLLISIPLTSIAAEAVDPQLCPVASDRLNRSVAYGNSKNVISAPETAEETAALMAAAGRETGDARSMAIMQLALAGDLEAFRMLFDNGDVDGVYIYSGQYLNADDTVCVDPLLERVLVENLSEPRMGHRLSALLWKNTYRSRETLSALRAVPFDTTDARRANQYLSFGRAITATHLWDIEAEVLEHARSLLPFDSPLKKNVLPGLHQHYAGFFESRNYGQAVGYLRELLAEADRDEPVQSFQIKYGQLRTVVLRSLASLGGAEAYAAIVAELDEISRRPLDPFAAAELDTISRLAVTFPDDGDRDAAVAAYARVLETPQAQRYDYAMRRTIYAALGALATPAGHALLSKEIERYFRTDAAAREAALAKLFESLRATENLDIEPVLALVEDARSPAERRWIWGVAGGHPDAGGVTFLLAELQFSLTGGSQAEQLLGPEAGKVLLNMLAGVETATAQNQARDGLDALLDAGLLPQADYLAASGKLNKALGDQSGRYLDLQQQLLLDRAADQEARQQAALKEGMRENQASFAAELARNSSAEGIAANIAALSQHSGGGSRAFEWLVIVGQPALAQLHDAVVAPGTDDRQRYQVMSVLGEIGNPNSTDPIIEAARTFGDGGFHRPAFFALALIPPTDKSLAFADEQLADGVPERQQIAGLVYFAQIRHAPAADLVARYSADDASSRTHTAALYLGARLGVPGVEAAIADALTQMTERTDLETLVMALAEVASSAEEFKRIASSRGLTDSSSRYRQNVAYCAFRTTADAGKVELALQVVGEGNQWQRREAIRYLIAADPNGTIQAMTGGMGRYLPLHQLLRLSPAMQLLFSEARRMGYVLLQTDGGYVLRRSVAPPAL